MKDLPRSPEKFWGGESEEAGTVMSAEVLVAIGKARFEAQQKRRENEQRNKKKIKKV